MPPLLLRLLKQASRSFYLSLRVLPKKIRPAMGLGYLLARTADTIADTEVLDYGVREKTLKEFKSLFQSFPIDTQKAKSFESVVEEFLPHNNSVEKSLLKNVVPMIAMINSLSRTEQALIQEVLFGVITGMEKDLGTFGQSSSDLKAFEKNTDLEDYIGWIGGEPGRFWTKLTLHCYPNFSVPNPTTWIQKGIDFGKGLQMINILRDLPKDLQMGRCYIPRERLRKADLSPEDLLSNTDLIRVRFLPVYHALIEETIARLENGLDYLTVLPRTAIRMRASVWWPLTIGLQTLAYLKDNKSILDPKKTIKMTRGEVYRMMGLSFLVLPSNRILRQDFRDLAKGAGI